MDKIGGLDPYETTRSEWEGNIDLSPSVTSVHNAMYLLVTPSRYTGEDLVNYKSIDCYCHFLAGWVREILIKAPSETLKVVFAKVSIIKMLIIWFVHLYILIYRSIILKGLALNPLSHAPM